MNVKERNRSTQHASILTVYRATVRIERSVFKVQAVAQTFPVSSLHLLYVKSFTNYKYAQQHNAQEAQVHTPQYVFFNFQGFFVINRTDTLRGK